MPRVPFKSLEYILKHPLNVGAPGAALLRYLRWQLSSRLSPGPIVVDFVDDARLLVRRGMTGATGNVYCGLHEFEDMAFVLHVLRPGDLFADVGANVGSYTVLAAKAVGARVVAFEPVRSTYERLMDNVRLNGIEGSVEALQVCLGAEPGSVRMTSGSDTVNHVVSGGAAASGGSAAAGTEEVRQERLDDVIENVLGGRVPAVAKIDVEGYEPQALAGASRTLASPDLKALLIEILPSQRAAGGGGLVQLLENHGFEPWAYEPLSRKLTRAGAGEGNNTLFVRDVAWVEQRVTSAPSHSVHGRKI